MPNRSFLALAIVMLAGCASLNKQPISQKASSDLRGQRVAQVNGKLPDFGAITAGRVTFGLLGAMVMNSEGNKLVVDNHIPDPACSIAHALLSALASSHAVDPAVAPLQVAADDPAQMSAAADGSRFVLDVRTMDWASATSGSIGRATASITKPRHGSSTQRASRWSRRASATRPRSMRVRPPRPTMSFLPTRPSG
jgi:hypothetical protein